mmetsp:Transcript_21420/g.49855  ORF Transcript_21420/g.49855 Transcript_21420/m.49855 type:complete len:231 (-) Transcript_21420:209-901(-)
MFSSVWLPGKRSGALGGELTASTADWRGLTSFLPISPGTCARFVTPFCTLPGSCCTSLATFFAESATLPGVCAASLPSCCKDSAVSTCFLRISDHSRLTEASGPSPSLLEAERFARGGRLADPRADTLNAGTAAATRQAAAPRWKVLVAEPARAVVPFCGRTCGVGAGPAELLEKLPATTGVIEGLGTPECWKHSGIDLEARFAPAHTTPSSAAAKQSVRPGQRAALSPR